MIHFAFLDPSMHLVLQAKALGCILPDALLGDSAARQPVKKKAMGTFD